MEERSRASHDGPEGFSLIELLIVIVVLGALALVVVMAVGGMTTDAKEAGCLSDRHILATGAEAYFAQRSTTSLPVYAGDSTGNTYERSLVDAGFLRSPSDYFDLDSAGGFVQVVGSPCTA